MDEQYHREFVKRYISDDVVSPDGAWFREVPVGFSQLEPNSLGDKSARSADALCLVSRDDSVPLTDKAIANSRFRRLWEQGRFEGEEAVLIEAKTGELGLKAIGQIQTYGILFEEEWGIDIVESRIITPQSNPVLETACDELGIEVQLFSPSIDQASLSSSEASSPVSSEKADVLSPVSDRPGPHDREEIRDRFQVPQMADEYQMAEKMRWDKNLSVEEFWQRHRGIFTLLNKKEFYTGRRNP